MYARPQPAAPSSLRHRVADRAYASSARRVARRPARPHRAASVPWASVPPGLRRRASVQVSPGPSTSSRVSSGVVRCRRRWCGARLLPQALSTALGGRWCAVPQCRLEPRVSTASPGEPHRRGPAAAEAAAELVTQFGDIYRLSDLTDVEAARLHPGSLIGCSLFSYFFRHCPKHRRPCSFSPASFLPTSNFYHLLSQCLVAYVK